jgi:hypothetical protein
MRTILIIAFSVVVVVLQPSTSHAIPMPINPMFTEIGNNVTAMFQVRDFARGSEAGLPIDISVKLVEEDLVFDDVLGKAGINVNENNVTAIASGGYESFKFTITYPNASNAFTGKGDDYALKLEVYSASEPAPIALLSLGLVLLGLTCYRRRELKPCSNTLRLHPPVTE